jgi:hypothetical protein
MDRLTAEKVLLRAHNLPLYLHAYAFHLNMRMEKILPEDLLSIAHQQRLRGGEGACAGWGKFRRFAMLMMPGCAGLANRLGAMDWIFISKPVPPTRKLSIRR